MRIRTSLLLVTLCFHPLSWAAEDTLEPVDQKLLRELEQQVTQTKEAVFREKGRLHELEEAVLRGKVTGSKAYITFDNQAEGFFAFNSAEFFLDGQLVNKVNGEGRKSPLEKALVFDKDLPAGEHVLKSKINYRGSDKSIYTAFSYFKDHQFIVESTERFSVEYGKTTQVKLVALDKGYFKTDLQERLYLQSEVLREWGTEPPQ
ncbi:MAG TPA: hypothetical protein VI895_14080 [Bdellovibrionota bacterium]|nr:hypothetical protein [Bdellovibrionota bacterium]